MEANQDYSETVKDISSAKNQAVGGIHFRKSTSSKIGPRGATKKFEKKVQDFGPSLSYIGNEADIFNFFNIFNFYNIFNYFKFFKFFN